MKKLFDENEIRIEKKISRLELIVSRLARRAKKRTTAMITPYPISACISGEIDGEVLRYIFCARGKISRTIVTMNKKPSSGVMISVALSNELGGGSVEFLVSKRSQIIKPDMGIASGDKMIVSAKLLDPEKDKIDELWIGMLWVPTVKDIHVKSFLIDELEEKANDLLEE